MDQEEKLIYRLLLKQLKFESPLDQMILYMDYKFPNFDHCSVSINGWPYSLG